MDVWLHTGHHSAEYKRAFIVQWDSISHREGKSHPKSMDDTKREKKNISPLQPDFTIYTKEAEEWGITVFLRFLKSLTATTGFTPYCLEGGWLETLRDCAAPSKYTLSINIYNYLILASKGGLPSSCIWCIQTRTCVCVWQKPLKPDLLRFWHARYCAIWAHTLAPKASCGFFWGGVKQALLFI